MCSRYLAGAIALASTLMLAPGCSSRGNAPTDPAPAGGRGSESRDGGDEIREDAERFLASSAPIGALEEMVDVAGQQLVRDLATNRMVRDSDRQFVMVVDEFRDRTGARNSALQDALRSVGVMLQRNERLREDFVFLASSETDVERILSETSGDGWGDLDPFGTGSGTQLVRYHPDTIFTLTGDLGAVRDLDARRLRLTLRMEVVHPRSGQVLEPVEIARTYRYSPEGRWILLE